MYFLTLYSSSSSPTSFYFHWYSAFVLSTCTQPWNSTIFPSSSNFIDSTSSTAMFTCVSTSSSQSCVLPPSLQLSSERLNAVRLRSCSRSNFCANLVRQLLQQRNGSLPMCGGNWESAPSIQWGWVLFVALPWRCTLWSWGRRRKQSGSTVLGQLMKLVAPLIITNQ